MSNPDNGTPTPDGEFFSLFDTTGPAGAGPEPGSTGPGGTASGSTGSADTGPAATGPGSTGPADAGPADTGVTAVDPTAPAPAGRSRRRRQVVLLSVVGPLVILLVAVAGWYATTRKPLTQLPGLSLEKTPHYAFSIYGVTQPLGVAVSPDGARIYVTESEGARLVHVYDRGGKQVATLKPPASTGGSHVPVYVAVDPVNADVYVSDRMTAAVYVYSPAGRYLRTFAPKQQPAAGWAPMGLAFDRRGDLYVTNVSGDTGHQVLVLRPDGSTIRTLGAAGQLSFPNGLVVDRNGDVDVADSNNGRVVVFDATGKIVGTITRGIGEGDLGLPRGAAVDDGGRLFIVDTTNHTVRVYRVGTPQSPTPRYIGSFGDEGTLEGTFEYPNGVATDTRARIYITDRENNRVQVWSY